jgi:hypothetical protein
MSGVDILLHLVNHATCHQGFASTPLIRLRLAVSGAI